MNLNLEMDTCTIKGKKISELDDYPFSDEVEMELRNLWQEQYLANIALLFVDLQDQEKVSKIRIQFMDAITRAVERNFSYQIGDWCREHQVKYIGHIIEDNTNTQEWVHLLAIISAV